MGQINYCITMKASAVGTDVRNGIVSNLNGQGVDTAAASPVFFDGKLVQVTITLPDTPTNRSKADGAILTNPGVATTFKGPPLLSVNNLTSISFSGSPALATGDVISVYSINPSLIPNFTTLNRSLQLSGNGFQRLGQLKSTGFTSDSANPDTSLQTGTIVIMSHGGTYGATAPKAARLFTDTDITLNHDATTSQITLNGTITVQATTVTSNDSEFSVWWDGQANVYKEAEIANGVQILGGQSYNDAFTATPLGL